MCRWARDHRAKWKQNSTKINIPLQVLIGTLLFKNYGENISLPSLHMMQREIYWPLIEENSVERRKETQVTVESLEPQQNNVCHQVPSQGDLWHGQRKGWLRNVSALGYLWLSLTFGNAHFDSPTILGILPFIKNQLIRSQSHVICSQVSMAAGCSKEDILELNV